MAVNIAFSLNIVACLFLLLLASHGLALKCYNGDSITGIEEEQSRSNDVCARYEYSCWPGSSIDTFCKQLAPKNLTYATMYGILPDTECRKMTPPSYNHPLCCKEDLCNAPVVIEPPNPVNTQPTIQNSPTAPFEANSIIYYVIGGAIVVFLLCGIIIFTIYKKRNATDSRAKTSEEQHALLPKDYNINYSEVLGSGSESVVVTFHQNGQILALKRTNSADAANEEFKILRQLNHENILKAMGSPIPLDLENKFVGLPLERCDGTLAAKLKDNVNPLTNPEVYNYIWQLGNALVYLYDTSNNKPLVLHCDIKPHNILFKRQGASLILKLGDFNLAKLIDNEEAIAYDHSDKEIHDSIWTPNEVLAEKKYSISTDLFSFGVVCGQILLRKMHKNMNELSSLIEDIATNVQSDEKSRLIAKFCLKVIGEPEKRPKGGDAKTRLINFLAKLYMMCDTEKNDHPEETPARVATL